MVSAKEWTKIDPKDAKICALTTSLSNLEKNKISVLATFQGGGSNTTHNQTKNKGRDINKSYVEGLNNI